MKRPGEYDDRAQCEAAIDAETDENNRAQAEADLSNIVIYEDGVRRVPMTKDLHREMKAIEAAERREHHIITSVIHSAETEGLLCAVPDSDVSVPEGLALGLASEVEDTLESLPVGGPALSSYAEEVDREQRRCRLDRVGLCLVHDIDDSRCCLAPLRAAARRSDTAMLEVEHAKCRADEDGDCIAHDRFDMRCLRNHEPQASTPRDAQPAEPPGRMLTMSEIHALPIPNEEKQAFMERQLIACQTRLTGVLLPKAPNYNSKQARADVDYMIEVIETQSKFIGGAMNEIDGLNLAMQRYEVEIEKAKLAVAQLNQEIKRLKGDKKVVIPTAAETTAVIRASRGGK